ncbi:Na+/H+ antiporter NhaA [Helicobacter brantae]|uniref:Na(+)/H(+) antiporter NhaA n=1 Tax=Helicobacter brantae TaxID=375927 RepID=A0A3D8J050_9HELI|nr:Na+/H+ antiporter NhaA [Helicobacter brantae]RDU70912.1 Na+/H+ antiporter NhaA [Helicobacter brantae]
MEKFLKPVLHDWRAKNSFYLKERLQNGLYRFIGHESFSGILLFVCVIVAMILANLPSTANHYFSLWESKITLSFNNFHQEVTLIHLINDFLMSFFFLMVGLEMKREVLYGDLMGFRKMSFSMFGALGGIVVPIAIYLFFNRGLEGSGGFGIAMSTDTAFALGVIFLLGKRIPSVLKIFLVTLAVTDDLGAVVIITIFYTECIDLVWLSLAGASIVGLIYLNFRDTKYIFLYLVLGAFLWYSTLKSGIHPTIAAVLLAFCIPGKTKINKVYFEKMLKEWGKLDFEEISKMKIPERGEGFWDSSKRAICKFFGSNQTQELDIHKISHYVHILDSIGKYSYYAKNPLLGLEFALQPICAYFIVPLFAFANGGVRITEGLNLFYEPMMWGIVFGLVVGKPIGILLFTYLSERLNISIKPKGLSYKHILSIGFLAGIGFTMSMFVATLAYEDTRLVDLAKLSVLFSSLIATILGITALFFSTKSKQNTKE